MRAAVISALGTPPVPSEHYAPHATDGQLTVEMEAAAINPVDIAIATGTFYAGHPSLPFVPCIEGVGRIGGRLVYIQGAGLGITAAGLAAGRVAAPAAALIDLPGDADPAIAAALGTAGLAGWMAVREASVTVDDVVVVLGASGSVGKIAMQAARLAGARRVVAVGRSLDKLATVSAFADALVGLGDDYATRLMQASEQSPSVVIDLLWGDPLIATLGTLAPRARVIQVGASAAPAATVASAAVRGKQIRIIGYSNFGLSRDVFTEQYLELVGHVTAGRVEMPIERFSLDQIGQAWSATMTASAKAVICFKEDDR